MRHAALYLAGLLATLGVGQCAAIGAVSFFDGTFANDDWTVITVPGWDYGTATGTQIATGGNPDFYREITNTVQSLPLVTIHGFHIKLSAMYDPSVQGAIATIDYSEDSLLISGFEGGEGQFAAPALVQGGMCYYASGWATPEFYWVHHSASDLTADSFLRLALGPPEHPDFSASGSAMEFGFLRGNSTSEGASGYTCVGGIDNWSVTVNLVPDPATLSLLALGGLALLRRRK